MTRRLVVLAGLPRSGKSTEAQRMGMPIVNPDAIRLAVHGQRFCGPAEPLVWPIAYYMAEALFRAGHSWVVVDATNGTAKRRQPWEDLAKRVGAEVDLRVIDTSPAECVRRALLTEQADLLPVIARMARDWDLPRPASWLEAA